MKSWSSISRLLGCVAVMVAVLGVGGIYTHPLFAKQSATPPTPENINDVVCNNAVNGKVWETNIEWFDWVLEAKRRGLTPQDCNRLYRWPMHQQLGVKAYNIRDF